MVALPASLVGGYELRNPNGVQLATPWPALAYAVAAASVGLLAAGVVSERDGARRAGFGLAPAALLLLAAVAAVLSFSSA